MSEARALGVATAVQLAHALTAHVAASIGVRSLCVKGPVLSEQKLRSPRMSSDADVLVDPARIDDLVTALRLRGWKERFVADVPRILDNHAVTLFHPEWPCDIDVHHGFLGFLAPKDQVFETIWARRRNTQIAATEVVCADPVANSAMLALHCLREIHVARNRSELAELAAKWTGGRSDLNTEDLLQFATDTGSVETLRPFLQQIRLEAPTTPFDPRALAAWNLHASSVGAGRAAAWLAAITTARWSERPRLLSHAILPPENEYRLEHPEIGPDRWDFAAAIARRGLNGARTLPPAVVQLMRTRRLYGLPLRARSEPNSQLSGIPAHKTHSPRTSLRGGDEMTKSVAIIGTRGYPSYYGGFETAVRRLAPHLADRGWDVTVYGRDGSTKDDDVLRDSRVRTRVTRGIESKSLSTLTYGLTACVDAVRRGPDVALVMNVANGFWLPLLRARGVPTAVNVDGIEWDRAKWGRLAKKVFRGGAQATAVFGDELIYDANEISKRWRRDFNRDGTFIPYGGDDPGPLPVPDGLIHRNYILIVARFVPENTVTEFLKAAETLADRWPVVIVGSSGYGGELDDHAERLAAQKENVTWLGHVSDDRKLFSLWQHAGAYFHGHSVGGTNPALVQAMSCGAPVVARDTVYNREVLADTAEFVQPTVESIVSTVTTLMQDPARQQELSTNAYDRGREHYSWELVCDGYEAVLESLIAKKRWRVQ